MLIAFAFFISLPRHALISPLDIRFLHLTNALRRQLRALLSHEHTERHNKAAAAVRCRREYTRCIMALEEYQ